MRKDVLECFTEDGGVRVYNSVHVSIYIYIYLYTHGMTTCFQVEPGYFMQNELQFFVRWPISATKTGANI